MAFSIFKVLKGLLITEENTLTPKEIEIIPGGTASTKTTVQSSQTTNQTLTLPDATDTLVGKATTDTLTNKSINADTNTITNIEDADIKALAAIDATKIADGSVTSTEFQYLGGVTSDIQTQLNTNATGISDHLTDTTDAHDASAISNVPAGNLAATDVQAALDELQSDVDSRLSLSGGTMTGNIDLDNNALSNVPTPTNADHAANKEYVDSIAAGLDPKSACRVATTADLSATYATTPSNGQFTSAPSTIDTISLNIGDRVLVKDQTDAKENGIYVYTAANELTRSTDMDGSPASEVSAGNFTFIAQGTVNESKGYLILGDGILTLNTDNINWSQFSGATNTALRDLSNLTSPTAINQHLLPDLDVTRNIGSSSLRYNTADIGVLRGDGTSNISVHVANRTLNNASGLTLLDYFGTDPSLNNHKLIDVSDAELSTDAVNRQSLQRAVKNYIANNDAILDISGWTISKNTSAAAVPDSGFVTSGVTNTIARSTSSPLRGNASFLYTLGALGNQLYYNFTIDSADKYKVLQGSFDYAIASGTYADDSATVWIYDVTNAKFIQPAPYLLKNHSLPSERMPFEFQCSDSTSYRLIIHQAAASTAAIKFDNVVVGPQAKLYGSAVTDWVSYTPTTSWPSNTIVVGKWRRVGDSMELGVNIALTGVPTSADLTVNLPSGYSIDTSKLASSTFASLGTASILDSGTRIYLGEPVFENTTTLRIFHTESGNTGAVNQANPAVFTTNDNINILAKVPIQGWSSSQIMSQDASTRVVAARATKNNGAQTSSGSYQTVSSWATPEIDTVGAFNATTGAYTVKVPGKYLIHGVIGFNSNLTGSRYVAVRKNGSGVAFVSNSANAVSGDCFLTYSGSLDLIVGDTVEIVAFQSSGGNLNYVPNAEVNNFNISMLQGPAQIMASSSVSCKYRSSSGQSIPNNASTVVNFSTKDWDSNNAVTTGASWKFQPGISGEFEVNSKILLASGGGWGVGETAVLVLRKNGTDTDVLDAYNVDAANTNYINLRGSASIKLLATDYIDVTMYHNSGAAIPLEASANHNFIEIKRTGNY